MSEAPNRAAVIETNNYLPSLKYEWKFWNPYSDRALDQMQTARFTYRPISIGRTYWRLELNIPPYGFWIRRFPNSEGGGEENNAEQLSFQLHNKKKKIVFTSAVQRAYIGVAPSMRDRADWNIDFEFFITPENYAGGLPCDFGIVVVDKNDEEKELAVYAAHRSILSKGSPVFKAMLAPDSKFKEAKEGLLKIGNFSPETIKSFLVYAYTKNENLVDGKPYLDAMELLDAAEQYQIDGTLKNQCGVCLLALIDTENALKLLSAADRYRLGAMKQGVMEYIVKNRKQIQFGDGDEALDELTEELKKELLKALFQA